jgi:outer membrane autotransporter protein
LGGGLGTARGDTHGNLSSASLALGYRLPTTGVTLEPSLGVRVSHLNLDGFNEKGSELDLDVDGMSQTRRSAFTQLKASLTPIAVAGGWQLVPGATLDYERVLGSPQIDSSAQILGLDIEQRAAYATRDQFSGALNLTANLGAISLGAEAGATTGGDSQGFSGSLKASYRF